MEITTYDQTGPFELSPIETIQSEVLGFCLCGSPRDNLAYIHKMLCALDGQLWEPYENLPYMFFVHWANAEGYAEHGTTARCSWLTPKGKNLLIDISKALREDTTSA